MSLFLVVVDQPRRMLRNLDGWLEKAVAHAKQKSFEPEILLNARLAPDQYALVRQIQTACDVAKLGAARLSGQVAPKHPDTEKSIEEIRARIRTCVAYIDTFKEGDFGGAGERLIEFMIREGQLRMIGSHYLVEWMLPNFYFHVTTAYAILRHNGVNLGKQDFLGAITFAK